MHRTLINNPAFKLLQASLIEYWLPTIEFGIEIIMLISPRIMFISPSACGINYRI
jgi:hypothetical protein